MKNDRQTKKCSTCKYIRDLKDFHVDKSNTNDGLSKQCKICVKQAIVKRIIKYRQNNPTPSVKKCITCKEEKIIENFTKQNGNNDGFNTYCRACQSKINRGRNHPLIWNKYLHEQKRKRELELLQRKKIQPTLSDERIKNIAQRIRGCNNYTFWREEILERDEHTCQICDSRNNSEVDHYPYNFKTIILKYNIRTFTDAINCDALWDIKNGRVLCSQCHQYLTAKLWGIDRAINSLFI